jgi:hypothetical protein
MCSTPSSYVPQGLQVGVDEAGDDLALQSAVLALLDDPLADYEFPSLDCDRPRDARTPPERGLARIERGRRRTAFAEGGAKTIARVDNKPTIGPIPCDWPECGLTTNPALIEAGIDPFTRQGLGRLNQGA